MRTHKRLFTLLMAATMLATTATAQVSSPTGFGQARQLTEGWLFRLADDSATIAPTFDDSRWQHVRIPHDWGVTLPMSPDRGSCQGYLPGGIAWYRCHLKPGADELSEGRRLYIYFEGVYNRSTVYVNGHQLGYRPSGFSSFAYDLTPHLEADADNVIAVRVDHSRQDDARWYTGSGINRPVWLVSAAAAHFALWGTTWKVKSLSDKRAVVEVRTEAEGNVAGTNIVIDILDTTGKVVATGKGSLCQISISRPQRWTLDKPYLYKVRARMLKNGTELDRSEVPMGLRTLEFSPDRGFALNGKWMKVKGVCVHDDAGVLGTAVPTAVWRHRLETLKTLGANAIRMSHNPHMPAFYDLCDTLGLLVMDEASDEWEFPKRKWLKGWNQGTPGYEGTFDYFEEWIDRDVADMVRRDRCHPSIFLWSIGNEVDYPNDPYTHPILDGGTGGFTQPMYGGYKPGQPNAERIGRIAERLSKVVRGLDDSRAVTGALAGVVMSNETTYPEAVDVVGYNYTESRYAEDHKRYPQRVIYGSENRHDLAAWKAVRDNQHIFGQFLWTGIDYLGESGAWPARGSEAGLLDLAGHVKPIGHYRAALWSETPVCYIGAYPTGIGNGRNGNARRNRQGRQFVSQYAPALWNYDEGTPVRVVCYTNAERAQLFLNDQPIGGEPTRDEATDILYWDIEYHAGTLRCEAANGAKAAITTSGRPYALQATADKKANVQAGEVIQVEVEVVDEQGHLVTLADNNIMCFAQGARLLGLENGDARDTSVKTTNQRRAHAGRLVAYLAADSRENDIVITFSSPLLNSAQITLPR